MKIQITSIAGSKFTRQIMVYSAMALLVAGCSEDGSTLGLSGPSLGSEQQELSDQGSGSQTPDSQSPSEGTARIVLQGNDLNNIGSPLLSLNPDGPGGSPNQSLRSGDVLQAGTGDHVLIGALGIDVLVGRDGDDVLIGGTEDFNANVDGDDRGADNRDKAVGGAGDDNFIWAPGDGSDFFDGGPGVDVVTFGVLGEERDSDGNAEGAPFFNVNPPGTDGSFNFDGIYLNPNTNLPIVSVSGSPGFCTVLDISTNPSELAALNLDHLVRFSLRGVANAFDAGGREDDDGLRVALSLKNVEYVVCTKREVAEDGGLSNVEVLDITTYPPTVASLSDLPESIQLQIQ